MIRHIAGVASVALLTAGHMMPSAEEPGRELTYHSMGSPSSRAHPLGYTVKSETFRSDALPLAAGEVAFTNPYKSHLEFPKTGGEYAITKFQGELVDEHGSSVPLSEVYLHHWLVYNDNRPNLGVCSGGYLIYNFGIGAESRNTPVEFPAGYGWVANSDDTWGINVHILRTESLKVTTNQSQALKECIECWPGEGKRCKESSFQCCMDGAFCPTDGSVSGQKTYYFQYTIEYVTDVQQIQPVHAVVLDASGCQVETNIPANNANPWHVTEYAWKSPITGNIVFAVGHIHNAGKNITLLVNDRELCTTTAVYGTEEGKVGNEKGYIVANPSCVMTEKVSAGDKITVRSHYWVGYAEDPTGSLLPGGFHGGVMSYFYLAVDKGSLLDAQGRPVTDPSAVVFEPATDAALV